MSRRGKERDRRNAFREGAVDPALFGDEAQPSPPFDWTSPPGEPAYTPRESHQQYTYPPNRTYSDEPLTPGNLVLSRYSSGMEEAYPVENASGL